MFGKMKQRDAKEVLGDIAKQDRRISRARGSIAPVRRNSCLSPVGDTTKGWCVRSKQLIIEKILEMDTNKSRARRSRWNIVVAIKDEVILRDMRTEPFNFPKSPNFSKKNSFPRNVRAGFLTRLKQWMNLRLTADLSEYPASDRIFSHRIFEGWRGGKVGAKIHFGGKGQEKP